MDKKYSDTLRALRRKHDYLQQDIADKLNKAGVPATKTQVSRWETGINNPTIDQFIGLCDIYGVKDVHAVFANGDLSDLEYAINRQGMEKLAEYKKLLVASGLYAPVKLDERVIPFRRRTAPMYDIGASMVRDSSSIAIPEMVEVLDNVRTAPPSGVFAEIRWSPL